MPHGGSRARMSMLKVTRHGDVTRFDIARTMLGRGRYWTTAYLVDDLLIDTGCAFGVAELTRHLAGTRVATIVNTHTHEDHIGGNGALQRRHPEPVIRAHPLALPVLHDPRREQPLHPYRRIMWGWPEPCRASALADGEEVASAHHRFQVIFTPGHSADHLCLFEPDRGWLFTGDLFVGGYDRALREDCDVWAIIDSLKRVAALPASTLFPGCARVRDNPAQALADKIDYLEGFGASVLELAATGLDVDEITRGLCGRPMFIEFFTLGHFSRPNLVRSFLRGDPTAVCRS
jgi:glyoxylase-like metal-dependent hydrolase (beta-lactamase superfamily II)